MGAERIPDLQQALPLTMMKPSRTARILKPTIVLIAVVVLGTTSIIGIYTTASTLSSSPHPTSEKVAQGMVLGAVILSISYVFFHVLAMRDNESVGIVRPPVLKLHAACFIVARLGLVTWIMAMLASIVVVSRRDDCKGGSRDCKPAVLNLVISNLACLSTGTVLTALEACKYPFQSPEIFHLIKKLTSRVSPLGEDLLERSVSRTPSFDRVNHFEDENREGVTHKKSTKQKPLPNLPSPPMEEQPAPPFAPLYPRAQRIKSRSWGDEWRHPAVRPERKIASKSDSAVSGLSRSSSGYISSDHSSDASLSKRQKRPKIVTPSSSISNLTKRSPLSIVRSAESPDIVVRPQLRYCPPTILGAQDWNLSRAALITTLVPIADVHYMQRRSSVSMPPQYVRRPSRHMPPMGRAPPIVRRRTADIKRSSSNVYRPSFDYEKNLEEHAKMIEAVSIARSISGRIDHKPRPPPKDPVERIERVQTPQRIDSRAKYRDQPKYREPKYREQHPVMRSHTTAGPREIISRFSIRRPHTAKIKTAPKITNLRPLSLGDISSGLGKLFDVPIE